MKKPVLLSIICISAFAVQAQITAERPTIGSGAKDFALNSEYFFSSTLGEAVIQTIQTNEIMLTQGFHQPDGNLFETGLPMEIKVYPNPVVDQLKVAFQLDAPAWIQFVLINNAGQIIKKWPNNWYANGFQELSLDIQVPSGLYLLTFWLGDKAITHKIVIE